MNTAELQPYAPAALHRTDLATPAHAALGIQAFALHIPNIFDPAGPRDVQGWVQSPGMSHPQYVGFVLDTDPASAIERLERQVMAFADDIAEELTPPPAPPAPAPAKPRARKPRCACPLCQPAAHQHPVGVFRCAAGREWLAFDGQYIAGEKTELAAKVALNAHRHEGLRRAA